MGDSMSLPFNRRTWFGLMLAPLARATRLNWDLQPDAVYTMERRYRADAQILLLGLPIYHRENVGGGRASWREWHDGTRRLEFAGFSFPERAAGLNRLGFIRELSRTSVDGGAESIYFGLMTSSPEESADEARKALHSNAKEAAYTAIEGYIAPGNSETATAHFNGPAHLQGGQLAELEEHARQILTQTPRNSAALDASKAIPPPFLHVLASALRETAPTESRYTYAGRIYLLVLHRTSDEKAAGSFRQGGLLPPGRDVSRVSGTVRREAGGKPIEFRLWIEKDALRPVPLRIEYQAKAYLRLVFEAVA
jgi:hypothetical protein